MTPAYANTKNNPTKTKTVSFILGHCDACLAINLQIKTKTTNSPIKIKLPIRGVLKKWWENNCMPDQTRNPNKDKRERFNNSL